jgi:hypothetical protein
LHKIVFVNPDFENYQKKFEQLAGALSKNDFRVKRLEFMSRVFNRKLPVHTSFPLVARYRPSGGFVVKGLDVRDAAA